MTALRSNALSYCAVLALAGADIADEMFGRRLLAGIDMDHLGDQELVAAIVAERSACEACPQRRHCFEGEFAR